MSSAIFPTLAGQAIEVDKSPIWEGSQVVRSLSGKRTSIAYWSAPIWEWKLRFNVLRAGTWINVAYTELQQLMGFFNLRAGQYDPFLFNDTTDNSVTLQSLGTGNGTTAAYQLVRTLGGFTENILAPNAVSLVTVGGVPTAAYSLSPWASSNPGIITFVTPPANTAPILATFTYYWPVEFLDARLDFTRFMNNLWSLDGVKLRSLK